MMNEPLPVRFIDRWNSREDVGDGRGVVYWHVLFGNNPAIVSAIRSVQEKLSNFQHLHMTPLKWLHMTVAVPGPSEGIQVDQMKAMLSRAREQLEQVPPIEISFGRIIFHSEAIAVEVGPYDDLLPLLKVAQGASSDCAGLVAEDFWFPHVTVCYSTGEQAAGPIISALGKRTPECKATIRELTLVVQRGPERLWDWHPFGAAPLLGRRGESERSEGHDCDQEEL